LISGRITDEHFDDARKYLELRSPSSGLMSFLLFRSEDILLSWLTQMLENDLYLFDGKQTVVKVDKAALRHRWYVDLNSAVVAGEEYAIDEYSDELSKKFNFCEAITQEQIDHYNEQIAGTHNDEAWSKLQSEMLSRFGFTRPPLFMNAITFEIDTVLYDFVLSKDIDNPFDFDVCEHAKNLAQYQGWFVVTPEPQVTRNWDSYWAGIAQRELRKDDAALGRTSNDLGKVGRPRKQEDVAAIYGKLFPNGHGTLSYKEILKQIEQTTGLSASVDTLKRAILQSE
ncbi:hypothetical protein HPO_14326, partial [Hyphomonas polymorpha PS728]